MDREEIANKIEEIIFSGKGVTLDDAHNVADWHIVELENATKELKQKLEDERYIKATVIENAKREARVEVAKITLEYLDYDPKTTDVPDVYCAVSDTEAYLQEIINQIKEADSE